MTTITQIQLIGKNAGYLEVDESTALPLNFSVAEIRDITKKKGTFSKSITLPGTKNNNKLLNHYFDVNIQAGTFNINKLQYCTIIQNGITILDNGLLQLISIDKSQKNNNYEDAVTYTVLVKDSTSDFFSVISNRYLTDITGFTWMNHIYTAANVVSSFTNTINQGYKYVMPFNPEAADDATFDLKEFSPGIYARLYMDKIFANAGYSYNWPSMNNDNIQFDKLIIPYNGDVVKTNLQDQAKYLVEAHKLTASTQTSTFITNNVYMVYSVFNSSLDSLKLPVEVSDPAGIYNPTTSVYTTINVPSNSNNLKFEYDIEYEIYVDNPNAINAYVNSWKGNSTPTVTNESMLVLPRINGVQNGVNIFSDVITSDQKGIILPNLTAYPPGITMLQSGTTSLTNTQFGLTPNAQVVFTSQLVISNTAGASNIQSTFYNATPPNFFTPTLTNVNIKYKIKSIKMKIKTLVDVEYGYNVPITITRYIPEKIKQSDFLKSIFTMYNLFAEIDKSNPKQINLTTRDEYYDNGKINNWTKKLAKEKNQELKFLPELLNKKMILTYKADEDFANTEYTNATKEIWGQVEYIFENQYVKDITKQEIIFSPTPMKNTSFGAVCPLWAGGTPKNNIRILIDGGAKPTGSSYKIYNYYLSATDFNGVDVSVYPHISHWNKALNPTLDINFGLCDYYFRTDSYGSNTNNNLFNLFWRRTLNQINDGKMLTAYFNLNEFDIQNVRLSDKIRIDNSWWNINKIIDYNANSTGPTKVELISIDDNLKIPFVTRDVKILERNSNLLSFIPKLASERAQMINTNLSSGNLIIQGKHNYITDNVTSGNIIGNNNIVNNDSVIFGNDNVINNPNSIVFGSNNVVNDGISNTMIVGDGFTATTGNTLYTNNIIIPSGGTINNISINQVVDGASLFAPGSGLESVTQINTLYPNAASGNYSDSNGIQNTAQAYGETVLGHFSTNLAGTPASIVATDTVFRVGNGTATGSRSDAFRVYNNGATYMQPITIASITTPVVGMVAFNSITNTLAVYDGTAWQDLNTAATMEKELIIKVRFIYGGTHTYTIIKDDLNYGNSLTFGFTDIAAGSTTHALRASIIFPTTTIANNLVIKDFDCHSFFASTDNERGFIGTSPTKTFDSSTLPNGSYNTNGAIYDFTIIFRALP
jgi:hypothetical protein